MPAALEPPFFRRGSENQCSSSHWSKTVPLFSYNRKNSGGRAQRQWQPPKPRIEANYAHSQPQPPRMPAALEPPFFRRGSENQCPSSHWSKIVPQLGFNRKNSGGRAQRACPSARMHPHLKSPSESIFLYISLKHCHAVPLSLSRCTPRP